MSLHSLALCLFLASCAGPLANSVEREPDGTGSLASEGWLLADVELGLAYSGYRRGQHPDRGQGAVSPTDEQVLEDLRLMVEQGIALVRVYDTGEHTRATLRLVREHDLPLKVLLGIWLRAEVSNHEGCPWLLEPIAPEVLERNARRNEQEVVEGIELARGYGDTVVAVNVGNEALVSWNDHMVPLERVIGYVRQVRAAIGQPVTVAENYLWWAEQGAALAREVDFLGVHSYPLWEGKAIDDALAATLADLERVRTALPDSPLALLEVGWATTADEFGERAGEAQQARYLRDLRAFARETRTTVLFFEAFDEPWKGDPARPGGAEKHWGLWTVDRSPKAAVTELR